MIIKYNFGKEYQASAQFINFIKAMTFPNIDYNEMKKLMKKYEMKINENDMKVGFYISVKTRTEHYKDI